MGGARYGREGSCYSAAMQAWVARLTPSKCTSRSRGGSAIYLHAGGLRTHVQRCQMQLQRGPSVMQLVISIHAAAATAVSVANSLHHRRDCLLLLRI